VRPPLLKGNQSDAILAAIFFLPRTSGPVAKAVHKKRPAVASGP